jgi:two-component system CheB/CheR fusion protein
VRGWVAGCATGEEAYSLAILIHEQLERMGRPVDLKLFATDVHRASLEFASAGVYDADCLTDVSGARLERYFERRADGYHVSAEIRRMVVFAPHNVIKDAPFTKLDIISCRNLLIYFQPHAQRKALSLFHFGLRKNGALFLGSSESPGDLADEFETLNEHAKVYRKRRDVRLSTDFRPPSPHGLREVHPSVERPPPGDGSLLASYDRLLDRFMPMSLLINERREILDSFAGAESLLRFKSRRPSRDLLELVDPALKASLGAGVRRAEQARTIVRFSAATTNTDGKEQHYRIAIEPIADGHTRSLQFLVAFEAIDAAPSPSAAAREGAAAEDLDLGKVEGERMRGLEDELRFTKENLQASIEELETSNEELQATNEELVASNEELQSTNEELHSVNEELFTVNSEYQKKIGELNELNRDMSHLLESTDVATIFLDYDLHIRKFTPRVGDAFALLPQDVGRPLAGFSHNLRYDGLMDRVREVLHRNERFETEVRDESGNCLFLRILPYRTPDGVQGVVLTLTEINALDRARTRLKELSAIVEQSDDAIFSKDLDGMIRTWNAGAERLYGWKAKQIVGQNVAVLMPAEQKEQLKDILRRLRRGGRVDHMETVRQRRDGTIVAVSVTISPIRDTYGRVVGASAIARDISARLETERNLRASEEKYQDLYHNAPDFYVTVDVRTATILDCNARLLSVLQRSRDEVVDKPLVDIFEVGSRDTAASVVQLLADSGLVDDAELRMVAGDGTIMDVGLRGTAVRNRDDDVVGGRFILRDITRRKRVELELRREVERRERFLAMLSHELRNPLHAVRTSIQLIGSSAPGEARERATLVIERQTAYMSRLLDDLLDVARITQDKLEMKLATLDLADCIGDAVETVRALLSERRIQLDVEITDRPLHVRGDRTRLQQVQANLLANAARFSPEGARVRLRAGREDGQAVVRIEDQGKGIDPALLERVFDLFVQAADDSEPAKRGLGVGLTLVRSIVNLHGGTVEAQSEGLGRGAHFVVRLPLLDDAELAAGDGFATGTTSTVLVVEDLEDSRETLRELLQAKGYRVITAADGEEGLNAIRRRRPDVALVDIGLPKLNGYELARQARATPNLPPIRLIAVTGWGQTEDVERAKDAGFDDHLVKPLDLDKLARVLS